MIVKGNIDINLLRYNDMIELECEYCHKSFFIAQKYVKSVIKRKIDWLKYCSKDCQNNASKTVINYHCDNCGIDFYRALFQANDKRKKSSRVFCSKSCAATYNNAHNKHRKFGPKKSAVCNYCATIVGSKKGICDKCRTERQQESEIRYAKKAEVDIRREAKVCKVCGNKTYGRGDLCLKHSPVMTDEYTLKDIKYESAHKSNRYTNIRTRSRTIAENHGMLKKCELCGYSKIVACCHIKSISSFDENTKVKIINDPSNLIGLCLNCHWELDHDILSEDNKIKIETIITARTKLSNEIK